VTFCYPRSQNNFAKTFVLTAINAVLDEQERQENQGATTLDCEAIMRASKANSSRSSAEALARAAEDAAFALQEARTSV